MNTANDYRLDSVTSKDGTQIIYRQLGRGPGVVLLHGAMESAASHMELAKGLATEFTVYLPERRGHDIVAAKKYPYNMQKEIEDLNALLLKTDAHNVFGVSGGGLIALRSALELSTIRKLALYEPALIVKHSVSTDFLAQFDNELATGDVAAAMVTAMIGGELGPGFMKVMPRSLLRALTNMSIKSEDKKAKAGDMTMRLLAPTLHYDFLLVKEMAETLADYKKVNADTLLLSGGKSPNWLHGAVDALEQILPHVKRIDYPELDHGGSSDLSTTNRGGNPRLVASDIQAFLTKN